MAKRTTIIATLVVEGDRDTAIAATWSRLLRWFNEVERQEKLGTPGALSRYSIAVDVKKLDVYANRTDSVVA